MIWYIFGFVLSVLGLIAYFISTRKNEESENKEVTTSLYDTVSEKIYVFKGTLVYDKDTVTLKGKETGIASNLKAYKTSTNSYILELTPNDKTKIVAAFDSKEDFKKNVNTEFFYPSIKLGYLDYNSIVDMKLSLSKKGLISNDIEVV